jgi:hypothetical protein
MILMNVQNKNLKKPDGVMNCICDRSENYIFFKKDPGECAYNERPLLL